MTNVQKRQFLNKMAQQNGAWGDGTRNHDDLQFFFQDCLLGVSTCTLRDLLRFAHIQLRSTRLRLTQTE